MRNVQQTSLLSYIEIQSVKGKRHKQVIEALQGKILNNREISIITGIPVHCVTPRVNELWKDGIVIEKYKKKDEVTNRLTIFWGLKDE